MRKHDLTNKKTATKTNTKTMTMTMTNTFRAFKERSLRLLTFETFDQSGEETRPDQQKDNDKDNYNDKYIWRTTSKSDL